MLLSPMIPRLKDGEHQAWKRRALSWLGAIGFHLAGLILITRFLEPYSFYQSDKRFISVKIIERENLIEESSLSLPISDKVGDMAHRDVTKPTPAQPRLEPSEIITSPEIKIDAVPDKDIDIQPRQHVANTSNIEGKQAEDVHPDWALADRSVNTSSLNLEKLAEDISCLNSMSEACQNLRQDVFRDYQLSETQKVWQPQYAHSGLPSEFYGLSEREILDRLGVKVAGDNGFYIPFTNIGLDGPLWDMLHGVNKHCKTEMGVDGQGNRALVKKCPTYLPATRKKR